MRMILPAIGCLLLLAACTREAPANTPKATPQPQPEQPAEIAVADGPKWEHEAARQAALRWILDNQKKAGDWGYMESRPMDIYLGSINSLHVWGNASTALCLMGLLEVEPTEEIDGALRRGFIYLIDAPDTPRATMNTFYNVWSHTYMIQALCRGAKDARLKNLQSKLLRRAEHELKRLIDHQAIDGGWGYYDFDQRTLRPSGELSTPFTAAAALVALHEAFAAGLRMRKLDYEGEGTGVRDHNVQIGLDYVERHRIPNGAYYYSSGHMHYPLSTANHIRGSLARSQSGDNALITWGRTLTQADIRKQLDTFFAEHVFLEIGRGRQMPHEAWYAVAPYYYYFGHYYAARNVLALDAADRPKYGAMLAEKVVAGQYDDGSFWDYPLYGYHKAYGTGFGLIILNKCKRALAGPAFTGR